MVSHDEAPAQLDELKRELSAAQVAYRQLYDSAKLRSTVSDVSHELQALASRIEHLKVAIAGATKGG